MPTKYKIILSIIVLGATAAVFKFQSDAGQDITPWVAAGLGLFMVFAIWLFPETKKQE